MAGSSCPVKSLSLPCWTQEYWGFYIEADRVAECFRSARAYGLAPQARTDEAMRVSHSIALARAIVLAVQRALSPGLTPKQWLLYQYSKLCLDSFAEVLVALQGVNLSGLDSLGTAVVRAIGSSTALVAVIDEAQLIAAWGRNCAASDPVRAARELLFCVG